MTFEGFSNPELKSYVISLKPCGAHLLMSLYVLGAVRIWRESSFILILRYDAFCEWCILSVSILFTL